MTRPPRRPRARRRPMVLVAIGVVLLGVLFVAVMPTTTYLRQRDATRKAEAELAEAKAERLAMKREADRLHTAAEIEKLAREKFGYQKPGEEIYNILPAPTDAIGLPDTWPFAGVERALGGQ